MKWKCLVMLRISAKLIFSSLYVVLWKILLVVSWVIVVASKRVNISECFFKESWCGEGWLVFFVYWKNRVLGFFVVFGVDVEERFWCDLVIFVFEYVYWLFFYGVGYFVER